MSSHQPADLTPSKARHLSDLRPGQAATIERLHTTGESRWRLMDLVFLPGTRVVAEMRGPHGEPTTYRVRDALVALRDDKARLIDITLTPQDISQ